MSIELDLKEQPYFNNLINKISTAQDLNIIKHTRPKILDQFARLNPGIVDLGKF